MLHHPQQSQSFLKAESNMSHANRPGHAIFVSIPLVGHLTPLVQQGLELSRRGWNVTFATLESGKGPVVSMVDDYLSALADEGDSSSSFQAETTIDILSSRISLSIAGDCDNELYRNTFPRVAQMPYQNGIYPILSDYVVPMWECVYKSLQGPLQQRVDSFHIESASSSPSNGYEDMALLLVGDGFTMAAYDLAQELNATYAVSLADPIYSLSDRILPSDFLLPAASSRKKRRDMGAALAQRLVFPFLQFILQKAIALHLEPKLNLIRQGTYNRPEPLHFQTYMMRTLILVTLPFSYEYPRAMGPLVNLVGAMLPPRGASPKLLQSEELSWIEMSSSTPIAFVNMGTIAILNDQKLYEMLLALVNGAKSGDGASSFRSIWRLSPKQQLELIHRLKIPGDQTLNDWLKDQNLSHNMYVTSWVSSQQALLEHENVKVFVSHCGCNSVMEAGVVGVPLVCIPSFADQVDMAIRGEEQGVAIFLDKFELDAAGLSNAIREFLFPADRKRLELDLSRVQHLQTIAGGVQRAADLIEHAAWYGVSHLATSDSFQAQWQFYHFDVVVLKTLILVLAGYFGLRLRRRKERYEFQSKHKRN